MTRDWLKFVAVLLAAMLLTCSQAWAQETYTLRVNIQRGETWVFNSTKESRNTFKTTPAGQAATQEQETVREKISGQLTIMEVRDGKPTVVRATFDAGSGMTHESSDSQPEQLAFPLAGKTVTLRLDAQGQVTTDSAENLSLVVMGILSKFILIDSSFYPTGAVAVGQQYQGDPASLRQLFQLSNATDTASLTGRLMGIVDVQGRRAAELQIVTLCNQQIPDGPRVQIDSRGTADVDLQTGQILRSDIRTVTRDTGDPQGQDPNGQPVRMHVERTFDTTVHTDMHPAGAKVVEVPQQQPVVPQPPIDRPQPPVVRPQPPATPGPFAGVFRSKDIEMRLSQSQGVYSGTITYNGQTMPATAAVNTGVLVGTFVFKETRFSFTAELAGDELIFGTNNNRFVLRRVTE